MPLFASDLATPPLLAILIAVCLCEQALLLIAVDPCYTTPATPFHTTPSLLPHPCYPVPLQLPYLCNFTAVATSLLLLHPATPPCYLTPATSPLPLPPVILPLLLHPCHPPLLFCSWPMLIVCRQPLLLGQHHVWIPHL